MAERPDRKAIRSFFFDRFAPYENEQLACVYDRLHHLVSGKMSEVAKRDIEWAATWSFGQGVHWINDYCSDWSGHKEAVISRGLRSIYKLSLANSYDQSYRLLRGRGKEIPDHDLDFCFINMQCDHD